MSREQVQLGRLAARASQTERFLGHQLARYATAHGLDDAALAAELGVPVETLANLSPCGRIRIELRGHITADVRSVAAKFGCDAVALGRIVLM